MKAKFKNSRDQQLSKNGFTLLELIIVFSVIAILSTLGIASFVGYSRSQSLQSAASELASTLNLAKARASSQVKPTECEGTLNGYKVMIDDPYQTPSVKYSLYVVCGESQLVKTTTLPDNGKIIFDSDNTTTSLIFFPVITGIVQGAGNVVLTGYSQTRCLSISPAGVIKVSTTCP